MKSTLVFLEKLTLQPETVTSTDARAVLAAGVRPMAFACSIYICATLNVINRLTQTLDFDVPPPEIVARRAKISVDRLRLEGKVD